MEAMRGQAALKLETTKSSDVIDEKAEDIQRRNKIHILKNSLPDLFRCGFACWRLGV